MVVIFRLPANLSHSLAEKGAREPGIKGNPIDRLHARIMASVGHRAHTSIEQQHLAVLQCCDDLLAALRLNSSATDIGQVRMCLAGLLHTNLAAEETELPPSE